MNENYTKTEMIVSGVLLLLLVLFLNPFHFWMPSHLVLLMLGGLIVLAGTFIGLAWKERVRDEREELHRTIAGRSGYVAGILVLVLGIVIQGVVESHIDPWLLYTLGAMILAKVIAIFYMRHKA